MIWSNVFVILTVLLVKAASNTYPTCSVPITEISNTANNTECDCPENSIVMIELKESNPGVSSNYRIRVTDRWTSDYKHVIFYSTKLTDLTTIVYSLTSSISLDLFNDPAKSADRHDETLVSPDPTSTAQQPLFVAVECVERKEGSTNQNYGAGERSYELTPNQQQQINFEGIEPISIQINSSSQTPLQGFALLSLDDGTWAVSTGPVNVSIPSKTTSLTLFSLKHEDDVKISWKLGEKIETTTTTTTTTTTKPSRLDMLPIYVLGVNEEAFVTQNNLALKTAIFDVLNEVCLDPSLQHVHLPEPVSCRSTCYMTDNEDRGCVLMYLDLTDQEWTYVQCRENKYDYIRKHLDLTELATKFSASKMYFDSCTELSLTSSWALAAIGISVGGILLVLTIYMIVSLSSRRKIELHVEENKEDDDMKKQFKSRYPYLREDTNETET